MTNDWRTVLDTGVIVSAVLLPRSAPRRACDLAVSAGALLVSDRTILELDEVLRRPKFDRYVSELQRLDFLAALLREAEVIEVHDLVTECRDPNDNKFLELALSGQGSHIVSDLRQTTRGSSRRPMISLIHARKCKHRRVPRGTRRLSGSFQNIRKPWY
ncbi:MAG: putative toxin-antitoxin system toxin component, PIN family [Planctomycetota bacterium]